jgi:uncharacterized membrane protein
MPRRVRVYIILIVVTVLLLALLAGFALIRVQNAIQATPTPF